MPTPFMHLDFAERIRADQRLSSGAGDKVGAEWSAFYLGSVAADYQAICDRPRESTHFYPLPLLPEHRPIDRLFSEHPDLRNADGISAELASFTIAYIVHLRFDTIWYREIMMPLFVLNEQWKGVDRRDIFIAHNILLTWLDRAALKRLPDSAESTLAAANSSTNIPFLDNEQMARWQRMLVEQLAPGAMTQTVEIYAKRLGMSPQEFAHCLDDKTWMQDNLFNRVPLEKVLPVLERGITEGIELIHRYLT